MVPGSTVRLPQHGLLEAGSAAPPLPAIFHRAPTAAGAATSAAVTQASSTGSGSGSSRMTSFGGTEDVGTGELQAVLQQLALASGSAAGNAAQAQPAAAAAAAMLPPMQPRQPPHAAATAQPLPPTAAAPGAQPRAAAPKPSMQAAAQRRQSSSSQPSRLHLHALWPQKRHLHNWHLLPTHTLPRCQLGRRLRRRPRRQPLLRP